MRTAENYLQKNNWDSKAAIADIEQNLKNMGPVGRFKDPDLVQTMREATELIKRGRTYEVSIDASPDEFLDWDKPLNEQPAKVRELYAKAWSGTKKTEVNPSGRELYDAFHRGMTGAHEVLRAAGIKGVRYKDQGSRGKEGGTYNYVVFDDKLISILKKYGIAGLIAAGVGPELAKALAAQEGLEGELY